MKLQSLNATAYSARCSHRTPSGRQCRQLSADPRSGLCLRHRDLQKQKETADLSDALLANSQNFQTAQGINFALGAIFRLLAANYISSRRASVLTFVCSQLLRTLPAIDADKAMGITDPTAPKPAPPEPPPITAPASQSAPQPCAAPTKPALPLAPPAASPAPALPKPDSSAPSVTSPWNPANPEPDPTKKPS